MKIIHQSTLLRVFSAILAAVVLALIVSEPVEAKGVRERLGLGKKKKQGDTPSVGVSSTSKGQAAPANTTATRDVLLVSRPKHGAEIATGATIAFIEFSHITQEVPDYLRESRTVEFEDRDLGIRDVRSTIESGVRDSRVCARQVASALAQHLADLNLYKVVTRDHIATVLEEQSFANSGSVDTTTSARLGKLIGADVLIYGQVQLCVSSHQDYEAIATLAASTGSQLTGKDGWMKNLLSGFKALAPEKNRSFVLAQVQLIEAQTGKRVFTTSLAGEFENSTNAFSFDMGHRELIYRAADDLANTFIDNFLARQEARYIRLYADSAWGFGPGVDLIQLGQCARAERHFANTYVRHSVSMGEKDIARLMYNHGVSLMCSNRPEEALDRLWASLRLSNDEPTFDAIAFTNDIIDRGRHIRAEDDPIIRDVENRVYPTAPRAPSVPVSAETEDPES